MSVAIAGLGIMGSAMAQHLYAHHGALLVWNRSGNRPAPKGAVRVDTPADLGRQARLIHLSLLDTDAVEQVAFGPEGIFAEARPGGLLLDHSTISASATRDFARRAQAAGWGWVDAPVSGGRVGAEQATLSVFLGASDTLASRAIEAVAAISGRATVMGPTGAGQATKAVNQLIVGGTFALLAEAVALARAGDVDAARLPGAMAGGFADSTLMQRQMQRMAEGPGDLHGTSAVMLKDLDLVAAEAGGVLGEHALSRAAHGLWQRHVAAGHGATDWVSILETVLAEAKGNGT